MKRGLRILNRREVRDILEKVDEAYGCTLALEHAFLTDDKNRAFIIHRDVSAIDFEQLRINSMGLYFAEVNKYGEVRLTIEGSQIVGPLATKNVVGLSEEQVRAYFKGEEVDVEVGVEGQPFVLLRYKNDFFGAAKYKEGKVLNYLPKVHRTTELIL